jgi:hypothetical protein
MGEPPLEVVAYSSRRFVPFQLKQNRATLRVQLVGYDTADIEALSRSFWNAR